MKGREEEEEVEKEGVEEERVGEKEGQREEEDLKGEVVQQRIVG